MSLGSAPDAAPGPGEALVRVEAAGVNFIDTYHRTGLYPIPLPFTPGCRGRRRRGGRWRGRFGPGARRPGRLGDADGQLRRSGGPPRGEAGAASGRGLDHPGRRRAPPGDDRPLPGALDVPGAVRDAGAGPRGGGRHGTAALPDVPRARSSGLRDRVHGSEGQGRARRRRRHRDPLHRAGLRGGDPRGARGRAAGGRLRLGGRDDLAEEHEPVAPPRDARPLRPVIRTGAPRSTRCCCPSTGPCS